MKKYIYIAVIVLFLGLVATIKFQANKIDQLKQDNKELSNDKATLLKGVEVYKTQAGNEAAKVGQLNLTIAELKENEKAIMEQINGLKIERKQLKEVVNALMLLNASLQAQKVTDTIYITPAGEQKVFTATYKDEFISNECSLNITTKEALFNTKASLNAVVAINYTKKRFLFFRWGVKNIYADITTNNPYINIKDFKYIVLKK